MINLVTVVNNLTISECSQIWHIANKFQNCVVNFHIGLETLSDQHHLTSLVYKLDWEKSNHNPNLNFEIYFPNQIFSVTENKEDLKWALIEEYLKIQKNIDYIVYVHPDIIFSQQPTATMWQHIANKTDWFGGGSLIYGKNLKQHPDWIYLEEYPIIDNQQQLAEYKPNKWPPIGIFNDTLRCGSEYTSWKEFVYNKYLSGDNLFAWEKNNVYF